jgi:hypothetical protein
MGIISSLLLASSVVFACAAGISKPAADFRMVTVQQRGGVGAGAGGPGVHVVAAHPGVEDAEGGCDTKHALLGGGDGSAGQSLL